MDETSLKDILKGALLLEHRGRALYASALEKAEEEGVKELFRMLVAEEEKHIDVLRRQFSRAAKGKPFDVPPTEEPPFSGAEAVLTREIVKAVSGAGYEAAVIAAALDFEKNAVRYYSEQAALPGDEDGRKLFAWLADWEKKHMLMLARVDHELKEKIWYDNNFWPLD